MHENSKIQFYNAQCPNFTSVCLLSISLISFNVCRQPIATNIFSSSSRLRQEPTRGKQKVGHPHGRKLTSCVVYISSSPNHKKAPIPSPFQSIAAQSSQHKSYAWHCVPRPSYAPTHDRAPYTNTPTSRSWTHDLFPNSSCGEWRSNGN